ncbi:hypothetical protein DYB37_005331 [Aphanomyces astaci]|uniref:Palmitoyltransferase n=3 Tax=Aphanomyces astaci TaxID=112090 RepID=A0A3L6V4N9_APHAT|nr:hypothetical protein DYB35_003008 [Aphanomyces astaci]RHZ15267.1 hypothetical protein DYB37_005331 [Aphanomyces astaci]RLO03734.1 hypothetical protein DYB28_009330 [Aphanomyces astaci]
MRVFCSTCKECEASTDPVSFDVTLTCSKCSGPCVQPSVFECAQYGLMDELKYLLEEVHAPTSSPQFVLTRDVRAECRDVFSYADKSTPLMWLCRYKFELDTMRMLIGLGANVHAVDGNGYTALHWAAARDVPLAAKHLIDLGIDLHAKTPKGETALDLSNRVAWDIEDASRGKRTAAAVGFLRKVYAYDQAYSTFPLSHSQMTGFWTPWVVLGLGGYATHALDGPYVVAGVLAAVAVGYALYSVAGLGVNPGKRKNASLMLGVNVGSTFWIVFVFLSCMADRVPIGTILFEMAWVGGILGCLYVTTTRDPGMLRTTPDERRRNIRELVDMKSRSEVKLCTTCIQRRPLRSKHDAELNGCVARFDHFCPFVANAVGAANHTFFLGFLVCAVAGIGGFLDLCDVVRDDVTYWDMATHLAHDYPVVISTCVLAIVHITWIGYLLGANIYGVLFAWTTNECVLQGRVRVDPAAPVAHHSKYSRGIKQNVIDFFHLPIGHNRIDWAKVRFYNHADVQAYQDTTDAPHEE